MFIHILQQEGLMAFPNQNFRCAGGKGGELVQAPTPIYPMESWASIKQRKVMSSSLINL